MPSVLIPQQQNRVQRGDQSASKILPAVGTAVGSAFGPAGAAVGGLAAGALAGQLDTADKVIHAQNAPGVQEAESAASRRVAKIDADPYTAIAQANMALERAPKDVQEAYRKPLAEAMEIARKSREQAAAAQSGGLR